MRHLAVLVVAAFLGGIVGAAVVTATQPAQAGSDTSLLRQIRENTRQTTQAVKRLDLKLVQFCRAVPDTTGCPSSF